MGSGPSMQEVDESRQPVIIAALRTPICRANGQLKRFRAPDLLAPVIRSLVESAGIDPAGVTDILWGPRG